jgi:acetyl-CoA acetyltransferase
MKNVYLAGAVRTPIGKFDGTLSFGLATLSVSGGMGLAVLVERV